MPMKCRRVLFFLLILVPSAAFGSAPGQQLRTLGYSLIPAPQEARLTGRSISLDASWSLAPAVGAEHIAVQRLVEGAAELHGLHFAESGECRVVLRTAPGAVGGLGDPLVDRQAYTIQLGPQLVEISGNGDAGLLYGVQSLLQLIRATSAGAFSLPEGEIRDWPTLPLRFIHWDSKHHQDRMETLKRYLDWASFFKVNAVGFEIEDKYEYPSHPIVGAPGAFRKSELQELTAYALDRYIQLVPQIQAPAHMAWVLKHEQFAHLRSDGSNYQACMCDEEAIALIQDLYQDMIDATPGVEYFHVSTDEVYYAGICEKCQSIRPYNDVNRSLTWVEYVNRMHAWLAQRGRTMLCWVEYPLLPEHLDRLPHGLINGVMVPGRDDGWRMGLKNAGVLSLAYNSQQGVEFLIPSYFPSPVPTRRRPSEGRLPSPAAQVAPLVKEDVGLVGTYAAAWDDSGLHGETFWLGWATVTQYGWSPEGPAVEQSVADFMDVFYGPGNQDLIEVYQTLQDGALFYESSLSRVPARRLKPSYGSWAGPGRDTTRIDLTLKAPPLPFAYDETLVAERDFSRFYVQQLNDAPEMKRRVDRVISTLYGKMSQPNRNLYNLEVLLSIARFEEYVIDLFLDLSEVEALLVSASEALNREEQGEVRARLLQAHRTVARNLEERSEMWAYLVSVWEKGRFPKGRSLGGRDFVHVLDDLKDHRADRRPGLDYMLEPLDNMGLEAWNDGLAAFVEEFSRSRGLE